MASKITKEQQALAERIERMELATYEQVATSIRRGEKNHLALLEQAVTRMEAEFCDGMDAPRIMAQVSGIAYNPRSFFHQYAERVDDLAARIRQFCASSAEGQTEEETARLRREEEARNIADLLWHIQIETGYKPDDMRRMLAPTVMHYPELQQYQPEIVMVREVTRYLETIDGFPPTTRTDHAALRRQLERIWTHA